MAVKSKNKLIYRILAILFAMMVMLSCLPICVLVTPHAYASESSDEIEDYSLYTAISNTVAWFGQESSDASEKKKDSDSGSTGDKEKAHFGDYSFPKHGKTGMIGCFVGFQEKDEKHKIFHFWTGLNSGSSSNYTYSSLEQMGNMFTGGGTGSGFLTYGALGVTLSELGVDDVRTNGGVSYLRLIVGGLYMAVYFLAYAVPFLFNIVIRLLQRLNPFLLFGFIDDSWSSGNGTLRLLADYVRNMYNMIQSISVYVIIPLLLGITIASTFILSKNTLQGTGLGSKLGKIFIRLFFILLAFPIGGMLYTTCLNYLNDMNSFGSSDVKGVVYTEFVDFENWAKLTRLYIADEWGVGYEGDPAKEGETISVYTPDGGLRALSARINVQAGHDAAKGQEAFYNGDTDMGSKLTEKYESQPDDSNEWKQLFSNSSSKDFREGRQLIQRYMFNTAYSASAFDNYASSIFKNAASDWSETKKQYIGDGDDDYMATNKDVFNTEKGVNIYNNACMSARSAGSNGRIFNCPDKVDSPMKSLKKSIGGLSTASMYNYLTSEFDTASIKVYSAKQASSDWVKGNHYSVNAVGTGLHGVLLFIQSWMLLFCIAIIALVYCVTIAISGIKNGVNLLITLPGVAIGSLHFIAKFISVFVIMIAELLGSIFLYYVFTEILIVLNYALSNVFTGKGPGNYVHSSGNSGGYNSLTPGTSTQDIFFANAGADIGNDIMVLLSIILMAYIAYIAIKNRRLFARSIDEAIMGATNRILGTRANGGHGGGRAGNLPRLGDTAKQAAAAGVGYGAGKAVGDALGGKAVDKLGLNQGAKGALPGPAGDAQGGLGGSAGAGGDGGEGGTAVEADSDIVEVGGQSESDLGGAYEDNINNVDESGNIVSANDATGGASASGTAGGASGAAGAGSVNAKQVTADKAQAASVSGAQGSAPNVKANKASANSVKSDVSADKQQGGAAGAKGGSNMLAGDRSAIRTADEATTGGFAKNSKSARSKAEGNHELNAAGIQNPTQFRDAVNAGRLSGDALCAGIERYGMDVNGRHIAGNPIGLQKSFKEMMTNQKALEQGNLSSTQRVAAQAAVARNKAALENSGFKFAPNANYQNMRTQRKAFTQSFNSMAAKTKK